MSLAACIRRWPSTTRWPWLLNVLLPRNGSSTDASASLNCRNSGSLVVAAEHQHDPGASADAADADDLAGRMDVAEALEQSAPVLGQRAPVRADDAAQVVLDAVALGRRHDVLDRDDQRRVARDPRLTVDDLGELAERPHAVLGACLRDVLSKRFTCLAVACLAASSANSSTSTWAYQTSMLPRSA